MQEYFSIASREDDDDDGDDDDDNDEDFEDDKDEDDDDDDDNDEDDDDGDINRMEHADAPGKVIGRTCLSCRMLTENLL